VNARKQGGTRSGFHFIESFKNCKRLWYVGQILGIRPSKKPFMLIFGGAFHVGKAKFYTSRGDITAACAAFRASLKGERADMEEAEKYYPFLAERGPLMLHRWADTFGRNDLANYRVLAVEKVFETRLPNGFTLTIKPDAVLQASNGAIYIFETKTSFFSANLQEDVVALGDQATTYLYAWRAATGKKASGVVPGIIYWNRNSRKSEDIELRRGNLITRNDYELWSYEQGVMSDLLDMSGRVRALGGSHPSPPEALFPRTTSQCISYNRRCQYADICREKLEEGGPLPGGFSRDIWKSRAALTGIVRLPRVAPPKSKKKEK
jgi:hypothetical protein